MYWLSNAKCEQVIASYYHHPLENLLLPHNCKSAQASKLFSQWQVASGNTIKALHLS